MQIKKVLAALGVGAVVSTVGYASASMLTVDAKVIQYGEASVSCDTDGIQTDWGLETDDNTVRSVKFKGIDASCAGADLFFKVNGGATKKVAITGAEASFSFPAPYVAPQNIDSVQVWIEG